MAHDDHRRIRKPSVVLASAVAALLGLALFAGQATRLAVFAPEDEPSYLCPSFGPPVVVGGTVYWISGTELLAGQVDAGRVEVVRDLRTGDGANSQGSLFVAGSRLFFLGDDGHLGRELWTSDGTPAGTTLVHEFRAGGYSSDVSSLTPFQDRIYFSGPIPTEPYQTLWTSDGSSAGTVRAASIGRPGPMLGLQSQLVSGSRSTEGVSSTLVRTDGTTAGLVQLATFDAGAVVHALVRFGAGALVWVRTGPDSAKRALWRTDLTPSGTVKIADVDPPWIEMGGGEGWAVEVGGRCFFVAKSAAGPPTLWRSDGSAAGTRLLATIDAPTASILTPPYLAALGGRVYFAGADAEHGLELWQSDGTVAGTRLAVDVVAGRDGSNPQWPTAAGGRLYFVAGDPFSGRELWVSDGTQEGTAQVADLCPGPFGSFPALPRSVYELAPRPLAAFGERVVFFASAGLDGCRLWVSDGTESGTYAVGSGVPLPPEWPSVGTVAAPGQVAVNGSVLVLAGNPHRPAGTYWTDGTAGAFEALGEPTMPGLFGSNPWPRMHGQMLVNGVEDVLRTDGTAAGGAPAFPGSMLTSSNVEDGTFYFWRDPDEVWSSDGTAAGTRPIRSFRPRPNQYRLPQIALSHGVAYFYADDGVHGVEPWRTDGTQAGTVMISDLCPGSCATDLRSVAAVGGFGYFADDRGRCLLTDGTAAGSRYVAGGCGSDVARLDDLIIYGAGPAGGSGSILHSATPDQTEVHELRSFDSLSLAQRTAGGAPLRLPILFRANDGEHGEELWRTDGTAEGTALVVDLNPGLLSSTPRFLLQALGRTFFTATSPEHGAELWSSDGTAEGTRIEADVEPGPGSSIPRGHSLAGNRIIFQTTRSGLVFEEWSVRVSSLPRLEVLACSTGEGRLGDGFARVQVVLSEAAPADVSVSYFTEDGTARAGADYLPVAGRLTIPAGSMGPATILVPLVDDPVAEGREECFVRLDDPTAAVLGRASATVTIEDDGYGRPNPRRRVLRSEAR